MGQWLSDLQLHLLAQLLEHLERILTRVDPEEHPWRGGLRVTERDRGAGLLDRADGVDEGARLDIAARGRLLVPLQLVDRQAGE